MVTDTQSPVEMAVETVAASLDRSNPHLSNGDREFRLPNGQREIHSADGTKVSERRRVVAHAVCGPGCKPVCQESFVAG